MHWRGNPFQALRMVAADRQNDVLPGIEVAEQPARRRQEGDACAQRDARLLPQGIDLGAQQNQPQSRIGLHLEYRRQQPRPVLRICDADAQAHARGYPDPAIRIGIRGKFTGKSYAGSFQWRHCKGIRCRRRACGVHACHVHNWAVTRPKNNTPNTR